MNISLQGANNGCQEKTLQFVDVHTVDVLYISFCPVKETQTAGIITSVQKPVGEITNAML